MYKANWDGATKHIFTTVLSITSHVLFNMKTPGKKFDNKYDIETCLQFNQVDFETWLWACNEHMLKINVIRYIDKIKITCTLYTFKNV